MFEIRLLSWTSKTLQSTVLAVLLLGLFLVTGNRAMAQVPPSACYELWDTTVTVSDASGASQTLTFGQGLFATSGVDPCDDAQVPPPPPIGAFYSNFLEGANAYYTEYRQANLPGEIVWRVKYQVSIIDGTTSFPATFSWDPASLPGAGTWRLQDQFGGALGIDIDMTLQNSFDVPYEGFFETMDELRIVYDTTHCTVTAVSSGNWNEADTWNDNCSGVPTATDDVYIPPDLAVDFGSAATSIESLTLDQNSSLTFSGSEQMTVSGNAFNRGGTLNLGAAGNFAVSGQLANYGNMLQTKTPAPTASFLDMGNYGGLTLTDNSGLSDSTMVEIKGGQICDTDNTASWRCFYVTPSSTVTDAAVTFYFEEEELHTSECDTMVAWRSTGGNTWVEAGTLEERNCDTSPFSVTYSDVTIQNSFSTFALRSQESPTTVGLLQMQVSTPSLGWLGGIVGLLILMSTIALVGYTAVSRQQE